VNEGVDNCDMDLWSHALIKWVWLADPAVTGVMRSWVSGGLPALSPDPQLFTVVTYEL